ncbi:ATP-binding cassette domain-containing protein [Kineococcus sp. R8]|uniref:ATP-binding cassette domain-containing protein n=1 Tax=Kineococcus siccus TaxID=2696567 RepID=UPI001411CA2C|nr:ATP-binding cassette domain-containing protein [Kineococcus siccus]
MSEARIRFENVGKRYVLGERSTTAREAVSALARRARGAAPSPRTDLWSLRDVDFTVSSGESLGIVGRNGAGKSTILRILARITTPTTGTSRTRGRVAALLEVGTGFHPELTGRENVALNGAILGMSRRDIRSRFDSIVDFSGVERFIDTPVKRYSSGMYLRLAFAVAAHLEPDILVVDEILAVGDAEFQRKCLGRMAEAEAEGRTIVFVSHDLQTLERLCERTLWMDAGRVRDDGDTRSVIRSYLASSQVAATQGGADAVVRGGPVSVRRLRVTPADRPAGSVLMRDEPMDLALDFDLSEPVHELNVALIVTGPSGARVLDELLPNTEVRRRDEGAYTASLRVPPVLTAGEHVAGLWIGNRDADYIDEPSLLPFTVEGIDRRRSPRVVALDLPVRLEPRAT